MTRLATRVGGGSYCNVCGIEKRRSYRLDPKDHERLRKTEDEVSCCIRDVLETEESNDGDDQIPECCHDLSAVSCAHPRTVFIKAYISYVVHPVFDFPVSPIQLQQSCC